MTDTEYCDFGERQVVVSARQRLEANECTTAQAYPRARAELADLLADRLRGEGHRFWKGVDDEDGELVGWLWVAPAPPFLLQYGVRDLARVRWLGQITVKDQLCGRGYGRALLTKLHRELATEGAEAVYLRVYNWNTVARGLYASCGYKLASQFATDAHLMKALKAIR
jgi:GNAT superfamily N-acetyltransferase